MRAKENLEMDAWITRQLEISKQRLPAAISAVSLTRIRPEFDQHITPARGSVLASPVIANWDPEPDYFFHWMRDGATVMRAIADLLELLDEGEERRQWVAHFDDIVDFSLAISNSRTLKQAPENYRARTQADCRRFLRTVTDLGRVHGDKLLGEPRVNPDGSVDILRWSRPQLDGPALRALAALAYLDNGGTRTEPLLALLQQDLDFTLRHAARRSIGPWEEPDEFAHHYHVLLVQLGALVHGRDMLNNDAKLQAAEQKLRAALDRHWLPELQVLTAIRKAPAKDDELAGNENTNSAQQIVDSAILLAILDADLAGTSHSVLDPRAVATLDALVDAFAAAYPINRTRASAPALGRSLGDRYFGGNAWYVTTLAAAAFCYRRAIAQAAGADAWRQRGDAWMTTVRDLLPGDGAMSEQIDRNSAAPRSARHLTWNYAAFISTVNLRRRALASHR